MNDLVLKHVSKKYRIRHENGGNQNSVLSRILTLRKPREDFWALKDISFEVPRGQALGIIGHNGAGKSTILKLLSKITTPSSGEMVINGRLSALIEIGSGFHPELTGRENVYLNGAILGMLRREITEKLDSIVNFAELQQFIDTPVKRYSSGMYVRLGFSIAAHLNPHILLLDEVLAVGDVAFQEKCVGRITELHKAGTTIVFISHDLRAVERLCDRVILLTNGEIVADDEPRKTIAFYENSVSQLPAKGQDDQQNDSHEAMITSLSFQTADEQESLAFNTGQPMKVVLSYEVYKPLQNVVFAVEFYTHEGQLVAFFSSEVLTDQIDLAPGEGTIVFECSALGLQRGLYFIGSGIKFRGAADGIDIDWRRRCLAVRVNYDRDLRGTFYMPYECKHMPPQAATFVKSYESSYSSPASIE